MPGQEIVVTWHLLVAAGSVLVSIISATVFLTWFIASQFSGNRRAFYRIISRHNREDDDRFAMLDNAIWKIHLRNARRDGDMPPQRNPMARRRYMIEDGGDMQPDEVGNANG